MRNMISKMAIAVVIIALSACGGSTDSDKAEKGEFGLQQLNTNTPDKDQYVMIETDRGNIKIVLSRRHLCTEPIS